MTTRQSPAAGEPCWADLWTSDVEGARSFYKEVLGWDSTEPDPNMGGYFLFTRDGTPVAGGMGDMPDMPAQNVWHVYIATSDTAKTLEVAEAKGAEVVVQAMEVPETGVQGAVIDPTGAYIGIWQPKPFVGFTTIAEPGAPSWFELSTRDHARAVAFYREVFSWVPTDNDVNGMTYTSIKADGGEADIAGIMDASGFMPEGTPSSWAVYWEVADVAAAVEKVQSLGGTVVMPADETPYGTLAVVRDPSGAEFKLRRSPA